MKQEDKYAVMLAKLILILAAGGTAILFPPTVLILIVGWAGWTVWKNYTV